MGTLRTLFAIAVVLGHSLGILLVGGRNAVQLFYMISGFLISYILVERKAYPDKRSFYINRFLRLYPIYCVIALLTLAIFAVAPGIAKEANFFKVFQDAPIAADVVLICSNITLFFQDWVMFAGVEKHQLVFSTNFLKSDVVLYQALLVPQAWTLGVELTFYLMAPFILSKRRILVSLLALSLSLRVGLIYFGLGSRDPWTYRFFPTELALFLLGALAHQVLLPFYRDKLATVQIEKYARIATYLLIFITLVFSFLPVNETTKTLVLFAMFLALMPLTFVFQSKRAWDKWIGDLSYPIYICHMLVIYVLTFALEKLGPIEKIRVMGKMVPVDKLVVGMLSVIISIGFATLLSGTRVDLIF